MIERTDVFNGTPPRMGAQPNMQFELRLFTMDNLMDDTPTMDLEVAVAGTPAEIVAYVKGKGLVWKESLSMIFGGFWYDRKNAHTYLIV